jgi:predicted CXXCH cytochrome family protein
MRMSWRAVSLIPLFGATFACGSDALSGAAGNDESVGMAQERLSWGDFPAAGPTTTDTPIGLAFEIDNGVGVPLKVRKGQRFYINQIDMRASVDASSDEGVTGLDRSGDFASLDWRGTTFVDQSFAAQNQDGTFTRRRFYRKAKWMEQPSVFLVQQVDAEGRVTSQPLVIDTGLEQKRTPLDSFFARRLRAIQWTNDCVSTTDCAAASHYSEEALIELRYANGTNPNFKIQSRTTALRVVWSLKPDSPYTIPVEQVENPNWDYGFNVELNALTPAAADGTYAPGQEVTFQVTLKDGAGKRLHPPGAMPSYNDFISGNVESGIQYWRGFAEPYATYYRRKHREKQLILSVMGPAQDIKPIYSTVDIFANLDFATGVVTSGKIAQDGVYAGVAGFPAYLQLFDPSRWNEPVSDTVTYKLPADLVAGTYYVVLKGRRAFLGEDIPKSTVVEIQVGTSQHTTTPLGTGKCNSCHEGGSDFKRVLHGLDNRAACIACHVPLTFEPEGPIPVRSHFIHSRSNRFDAPLEKCATCHLSRESIQRTSKSACLSCHKSYPASHVQQFGAITDMYVGNQTTPFAQCTSTCHTNHPSSAL